MEKNLYQWQKDCLRCWFTHHGRGMVQAVTGSGKTLLALTAARRLQKHLGQDLLIRIVVPTSALMRQWKQAIQDFSADEASAPPTISLRGGGQKNPPDAKYTIYVINTARYELARQILSELRAKKAVLLIADECHHYENGQNSLIFEFVPHIKPFAARFFSMGLSATLPPEREEGVLEKGLGPQIYHYGISEAAAFCTICPYDIFPVSVSFSAEEQEEYNALSDQMQNVYRRLLAAFPSLRDMTQKERFARLNAIAGETHKKTAQAAKQYLALSYKRMHLVCLAENRICCAFTLIGRLNANAKILVFGERILQADRLYTLLEQKYPGKVGRYHSKMGSQANKNALQRFRMGEIRILIACKALDEGFDVPEASIGIVLSGTSAKRQRTQRLGRIVRTGKGKDRAFLYYLYIEGTAEDAVFLPGTEENRIFELSYLPQSDGFLHPPYDEAANKLLSRLRADGADPRTLEEAVRCLTLGQIRSDWQAEPQKLEREIQNACRTREKNYWICMKRLRLLWQE